MDGAEPCGPWTGTGQALGQAQRWAEEAEGMALGRALSGRHPSVLTYVPRGQKQSPGSRRPLAGNTMDLRAQLHVVTRTSSSGHAAGHILSTFPGCPGARTELQAHLNPIGTSALGPRPLPRPGDGRPGQPWRRDPGVCALPPRHLHLHPRRLATAGMFFKFGSKPVLFSFSF